MTALTACVNSTTTATRQPVAVPVQSTGLAVPEIAPASTALGRVASALDVSVRTINATPRPGAGIVAAADVQPRVAYISRRLQCVPFARERSGVAIRGNANTWWKQAAGQFVRVKAPAVGSVIVMQTRRGHVGVVTKVVDSRTIVIDHSNWFSNGQIYLDQPVMDVSANNDWSKVVVWNGPRASYGKRALGVSGFIVPASARGNPTVYASLADVPATLAGNVQYAQAVVAAPAAKAKTRAVAPVAVAAVSEPAVTPVTKPAAATPVLVAEADSAPARTPIYVDTITPASKPASLRAPAAVASAEAQPAPAVAMADATPVYVDTIVPSAKPAALSAPAAVAAAETPVTVAYAGDVIVPKAKPASLGASTAVASAEAAPAGKPTYVDMIVPLPKPSSLGATAVALIRKGDDTVKDADAANTFIPSEKPVSVTTFR